MKKLTFTKVLAGGAFALTLAFGATQEASAYEIVDAPEVTVVTPGRQTRNGAEFSMNTNNTRLFTGSVGTASPGTLNVNSRIRVENTTASDGRIRVSVTTGNLAGRTGWIALPQFGHMTHVGGPAF